MPAEDRRQSGAPTIADVRAIQRECSLLDVHVVWLGLDGDVTSLVGSGQSRWREAAPLFGSLNSSDPPSSGADPSGRAGHRHAERAGAAAPVGDVRDRFGSPVGQLCVNPRTQLPPWGRSEA